MRDPNIMTGQLDVEHIIEFAQRILANEQASAQVRYDFSEEAVRLGEDATGPYPGVFSLLKRAFCDENGIDRTDGRLLIRSEQLANKIMRGEIQSPRDPHVRAELLKYKTIFES